MPNNLLLHSRLYDIKLLKTGKTRDVYDLGDTLLIIATDRISCFDVVLPTPIPEKGKVLTALSLFWFHFTRDIIDNHLITSAIDKFPKVLSKYKSFLKGRSMLVKKAKPIMFECIVRGYLAGSGWKEYSKNQSICGIKLPAGLKESSKLPEPIFTPSTKAEFGHDLNVSQQSLKKEIGRDIALNLKEISISLYNKASEYAESRGLIIADTKFEFGTVDGELILIDELLTPDSSRFWPKSEYESRRSQVSFDKQFVRDYLESLGWDKTHPGPELPDRIVIKTTEKYLEALKTITGKKL